MKKSESLPHPQHNGNVDGLDPAVREFIDAAGAFPHGLQVGTASATDYLRSVRSTPRRAATDPPPEMDRVFETATQSGVRLRVYIPRAGSARPIVVYMHGGGWVMGDLEMHDRTCRQIAHGADAVVVNVDYRLAPEHAYPAAADDALEATRWAIDHALELRADPTRAIVAGSSAGGNLAASVALRWRDERLAPDLAAQLLIYPVLDPSMQTESYRSKSTGFFLTADQMRFYWDAYMPAPMERYDPLAAPAYAESLAGVAPGLLITAEHDPLRDEGEQYAQRLGDEGALIDLVRADGQIHGFLTAFPSSDSAASAMRAVIDTVRAASRGVKRST